MRNVRSLVRPMLPIVGILLLSVGLLTLAVPSNRALLPDPLQPFGSDAQEQTSVAQLSNPTVDGADDAASSCGGDAPGMANPAAIYCQELGYEYQVVDAADGQHGICVLPDGSECDAWGFLQGKCGQSYSYCATQGYELVTKSDGKNSFSGEYGVCVRDGQEVGSVTELMGLAEKATKGSRQAEPAPNPPEEEAAVAAPPSSFDWRNYNGQDWMTSVKDQASCGGCWAFSAVGTTEALNNIAAGNPSLDLNLSEEYLVSDCYSDLDQSCCGGWHSEALKFIRDSGIPDEACLPWVSDTCYCDGTGCWPEYCAYSTGGSCANATCSDRCADWASRLETIASLSRVSVAPSRIKQHLVDRGPLAVCLGVLSDVGAYWDGDIYRCTDDVTINHCVVLTGYDDAGGYWIAKNSWGTSWDPTRAPGGYFKVGYGECAIETNVYYASLVDRVCTSYTSTDVPKAIPDPGTVTSNINVADSFALTNVNVGPLTITHTFDADLDVFLISPAGTRVELFTDVGGSGNNFTGTVLDDETVYPIAINSAPFAWTFSPEGVLADLNGQSSSGQWRLEVTDDYAVDSGTLNSWKLELCHDMQPDLTITKSASPSDGSAVITGGTINYTLTVANSGGATASNVPIRDTIGTGLSLSSVAPGSGVTCSDTTPPEINCTADSIPAGQSRTVTVAVTVTATSGTVLNGARVDPAGVIPETNEDADDPDRACSAVGEGTDTAPATEPDNFDCTGHTALPDQDADTLPDGSDNCPLTPNPDQSDADTDGDGDACDNCATTSNSDQANHDADPDGDACDADDDGDGFPDAKEIAHGSDPLDPQCGNATNNDSSDDAKVNDGCAKKAGPSESGSACDNALDDDADTWVNDGCPLVGTRGEGSLIEVCDGLDNDADTQVDEGYPDTNPGGPKDCMDSIDTDGDTLVNTGDTNDDDDGNWEDPDFNDGWFPDTLEIWTGTDTLDACPENSTDDAWAPDFNNDRRVQGLDILFLRLSLASTYGGTWWERDKSYNRRYDLNMDGVINGQDILFMRPYLGQLCIN
jgi:uncharacterized repeat protein (TIGR01451 family)